MISTRFTSGTLVAVFLAAQLSAQVTPPAGPDHRAADESVIRERSQAFARAFERGDAKSIADYFTEEGEYLDEGTEPVRGRAALSAAYTKFFANRSDIKVESKTTKVRFLGRDTAIEEGTFTVRSKTMPAESSRYSALFVRQNGQWLMAMLKEWGDDSTKRANLGDLAWLIGTWEADGGDTKARTVYEWVENKSFIRARYTITPKQGAPMNGVQMIGVHPASRLVHSWTFDADGGIGEASWSFDGTRWVIDSGGYMAKGSPTSAMNYLTRNGDDSFTWRSVQRTSDRNKLPDLPAVTVKRVKS